MDQRLYPVTPEFFAQTILPLIEGSYIKIVYDKVIYRWRRRIDMFFGKLKENSRLAVRYETLDIALLGFIALATIKIHLC